MSIYLPSISSTLRFILPVAAVAMTLNSAKADNVTSNAIFGSGNANGSFTIDTGGGVELGLRAKVRFNAANSAENTFNWDGTKTYNFANGVPGGLGYGSGSTSTASWNFEWSINTDWDVNNSTGNKLNNLTYLLRMDFDPTAGTNFQEFDPINLSFADHSIGDNSTAMGAGVEATDAADYASLIANNNLAQNSWNMEFFDSALFPFLNSAGGIYTFELAAFNNGNELARTSIDVNVAAVPLPAALPLFAGGLGLMGLLGWRRKQKAAA